MTRSGYSSVSLGGMLLGSPPSRPSPFLDVLYKQSDGHIPAITAELERSVRARHGEEILPLVSVADRSAPIAGLMRDNYPEVFQVHTNAERITTALRKRKRKCRIFKFFGTWKYEPRLRVCSCL
jgi:hypothetical protein